MSLDNLSAKFADAAVFCLYASALAYAAMQARIKLRLFPPAVQPAFAMFRVPVVALGILVLLPLVVAGSAKSEEPRVQRGRVFALANCSGCHAVGSVGASPLAIAPPFRTLHERYPVEQLEEALGEGIVTGHPSMPEFRLDAAQAGDLIAYLKSLE